MFENFRPVEIISILKQFSEKHNFQTVISIPWHALQEPSLQLRALGNALRGISMCHSNKHVQQTIQIWGRLNYICTSFFQQFQPNPQQWEQPSGSSWVSRFQGWGMHLHPNTLPWNPGITGESERGSLEAASPRDHPAQVQCRIKEPESAWKISLFLLTWIMAKSF